MNVIMNVLTNNCAMFIYAQINYVLTEKVAEHLRMRAHNYRNMKRLLGTSPGANNNHSGRINLTYLITFRDLEICLSHKTFSHIDTQDSVESDKEQRWRNSGLCPHLEVKWDVFFFLNYIRNQNIR